MHPKLVDKIVEACRQREAEGDCPTVPAFTVEDERMTVSEAIYLIVELKRMAARLGHDFEPSDARLAGLGFSISDRNAIFRGVGRNMRATSSFAVEHP